jgi:hypothetical protein
MIFVTVDTSLPPDLDNDDCEHDGDDDRHPIDAPKVKFHLCSFLSEGIECPCKRNADHQHRGDRLRPTAVGGGGGENQHESHFP